MSQPNDKEGPGDISAERCRSARPEQLAAIYTEPSVLSADPRHILELVICTVVFLIVAVMGFMASRWKRGDTMQRLNEWGPGGRQFGAWVTWFLVGGDLYTAYTFVAVPALMFGAGATGFVGRSLRDVRLPDGLSRADPTVVGCARQRIRHDG